VLSTSQTGWYADHVADEGVADNFLFIPSGATPSNLTDMVIHLREVLVLPIAQLVKNLRNKRLDFLPPMPDEAMNEIDKIITRSRLIPLGIKNKILK
jgi:hypothetical protein